MSDSLTEILPNRRQKYHALNRLPRSLSFGVEVRGLRKNGTAFPSSTGRKYETSTIIKLRLEIVIGTHMI
jgi:hypothetical protein